MMMSGGFKQECVQWSHPKKYTITSQRLLAQISCLQLSCVVGTMECLGLALTWEKDCEIRQRLRDGTGLMVCPAGAKFCEPTRANAIDNFCVLKPLLLRMAKHPNFSLPHLEPLQRELSLLFEKAGKSANEGLVYKTANEVKKLAGFVKRRVKRKEVTKERGKESVLFRNSSCYFVLNMLFDSNKVGCFLVKFCVIWFPP